MLSLSKSLFLKCSPGILNSVRSKFRAVIFDMGGVILPSPFPYAAEYEKMKNIPIGTIFKAIADYGKKGAWPKLEIGEIDDAEFGVLFSKECSVAANQPVDVEDFLGYLENTCFKDSIDEVIDAANCLRQKGYKTAVLTNNWKKSDGSTLLPFDTSPFDVIVESAVEGIHKPGNPVYQLCLNKLEVTASEAIFLDDMEPNITTAKSMGIYTIKVDDVFVALRKLENLLGVPLRNDYKSTRPVQKGLELDAKTLMQYLNSELNMKLPWAPEIWQLGHGQSNPTYLVDCGPNMDKLVLRKKPPGKLLSSAHAIDREYRVMKAIENQGVKVAKTLSYCEDPEVLGTPFYLTKYIPGNIYQDPLLPGMSAPMRRQVYFSLVEALCSIHKVDLEKSGLSDYGKQGNFVKRQIRTWSRQYELSRTRTIPAMDRLIEWLPQHLPTNPNVTLVHGDFRLDNVMFEPGEDTVLAVLDWELSTLGDPLADITYACMQHYLPLNFPLKKGLGTVNISEMGIPTAEELMNHYCTVMGIPEVENYNFYMAFSFFKIAAIAQGIHKRFLQGQSSASNAASVGQCVDELAELGWTFAAKEGFRIFNQKTLSESSTIAGISSIDGKSIDPNSNSDSGMEGFDVDC